MKVNVYLFELICLLEVKASFPKHKIDYNKVPIIYLLTNQAPSYYAKIAKTLFLEDPIPNNAESALIWQLKQMERIVDLIVSSKLCSSVHNSLKSLREKLKIIVCLYKLLELFNLIGQPLKEVIYHEHTTLDPQKNILLAQDETLNYYYKKLFKLFVYIPKDCSTPISDEEYINWQILQAYRLTNTILASHHPSVKPFKASLKKIVLILKNRPFIKEIISEQEANPGSRHLVCSGHGHWEKRNGKINSLNNKIIFYSSFGSVLNDALGILVENNRYCPKRVTVRTYNPQTNKYGEKLPYFKYSYLFKPFIYDKTQKFMPNYTLSWSEKDFLCAKIICMRTGEVLFDLITEGLKEFLLSDVLEKFPLATIHWAACTYSELEPGENYGYQKRKLLN